MKYNFDQSIGRITQIVSKSMGEEIIKEFHKHNVTITADEWTILAYLAHYKTQNQNQLSIATGRDKVAITRYIAAMEITGYVEREQSADDKRANTVKLTKQGKRLYKNLEKSVQVVLEKSYKDIPKKDLKTTTNVLQQILDNLGK